MKRRMSKRAMQLSATFMVVLILTIVIFTGSIYFVRKFFSTAQEMKGRIDSETQQEIESLLYNQNALVGVPLNKKDAPVGQSATFGLGIRNTYEEPKEFYVSISFSGAYDINEEVISTAERAFIDGNWLLYGEGPHLIDSNDFVSIPVLINVDTEMSEAGTRTQNGATYTFNVCVFDEQSKVRDCQLAGGGRAELLGAVYGGKVLKLNVQA